MTSSPPPAHPAKVPHLRVFITSYEHQKSFLNPGLDCDREGDIMSVPKSAYVSDVWKDGIFDGKVVFCTGGAGTICSAQVRALVHLGANACIVGRNVSKTESMAKDIETARSGSRVLGIGGVDVRRVGDLEAAVERCVKELGGLDYCIAGAAGNFLAPMNQLSANAFKSVIDIDVLGSYNTIKATLPHLLTSASKNKANTQSQSTGGRIIFVSATLHYSGTPLQAHVMAAKAAVDALCYATAIEQGPLGVTSNVIAPGPIAGTEGLERLAGPGASARGIPLGRYGSVKEIADATVFLFGDAGNYINGAALVVDGGHWRTSSLGAKGFEYPDFLLSNEAVTGVKGGKKAKL